MSNYQQYQAVPPQYNQQYQTLPPQYNQQYQTLPPQYNQQYQSITPQQNSWTSGWLAFNDQDYLKGLAIGAGLTFLLTNPAIQRAMVKGAVTLWTSVQGGLEEVKEQIQDIKSEMSMKG